MTLRWPEGRYTHKEDLLRDFKELNNIEYIEEDVFLDCLIQEDYEPYKDEDRYYPPLLKKFYIDTSKVQPKIRKRSVVRDMKIEFIAWFVKITDRILR